MKVRIKFRKYGVMKFIGHLDMMRYFQKAMRRASIPIAYSQGYSPHMIMSFANPLGVGLTSDGEYFDIELVEAIPSEDAVKQLNEVMVEGVKIVSFVELPEGQKTGMSIVAAADYKVCLVTGEFTAEMQAQFHAFEQETTIQIVKKTKKSEREVDIRPLIYHMHMEKDCVRMQVATGSVENLKPDLVMDAFFQYAGIEIEAMKFQYHREEVYAQDTTGKFVALDALGTEIQ